MKTTMDELFMELNKDNTPINLSTPGADLNQVAAEMDKKLNQLIDKIEKQKEEPPKGTEGAGEPPKGTEGAGEPPKGTEGAGEPPKGTEGAGEPPKGTEGAEGGGEGGAN